MNTLGEFSLLLSLAVAAYAGAAALLGHLKKRPELVRSSEQASLALAFLLGVSTLALLAAFLRDDFSLAYVMNYSRKGQGLAYKVSALYGGQDGSLLFWSFMLSIFVAVVTLQNRYRHRELMPYVMATNMGVSIFFLAVLNFFSNPFTPVPVPPPDGHGLNPLLQNPGMFFHPPTLYIGYVGFTIPFAFAMAALITGRLGDEWIRSTRRWTLVTWFFLTLGNMFGAWWAYEVLGWGGYWAWDPVENASFLPWLTGTAYLHSVMIQEKKDMLKVWNMVLIIATFGLSILGTFLTRSGILSSVHTFSQTGLGPLFLGFLAVVLLVSLGLLFYRLPELRSKNELDGLVSRETSFLVNNLLLVGVAFTTLWGTFYPLIAEAVRGVKVTVGPPFFNQVMIPIGIALLFLTGVCPLIAWRRASWSNLKRNFLLPFLTALLGAVLLIPVSGVRDPLVNVTFGLLLFIGITIGTEFYRGTRARAHMTGESFVKAFSNLVSRNKRRYGGYIIHLGILLLVLAVAGGAFKVEKEGYVKKGESLEIGPYTLKYENLVGYPKGDTMIVAARMAVYKGGKFLQTLLPQKQFHPGSEQPHGMVAIRSNLKEDLYVILAGYDPQGASFRVLVNPLMMWMWIGTYVMGFGILVVMGSERPRKTFRSVPAVPREVPENALV
ncbi:MAG: heme lyase CcmF/NrfE family subunit [Candidatus Tectomicrobia bacterium]|uniref:Heme lyase CcmF/NrfE family subunit n=1 Tax=Tectimicrobiota bacterium TaxID=2528274 RepID=A0A932GRZ5_UNCTE|nr:heme lyase CcmF/NrfE family subunit [Candidatus Tectomicrobia bacterium]